MAELVVFEHVTLDGVMQAPGRPDEDRRDGFTAGGWAAPYMDSVAMAQAGKSMATSAAMLFGRRTYQDFHGYWPKQTDGNPFTAALNAAPKYVVSTTLTDLPWENSALLPSLDALPALKARLTGDLVVLGSGELVASLGTHVDRYVLSTYPLALGHGRRLRLPPGEFELTESVTTGTGVVIGTYVRTTS
ncbi:dihydrofolate reductase family protein [Actinophytocola sp. NPDC049390]|uniref:dihydrofolate reductase family protein n=1 Tax=Actinophytocola sp. NPDC049390 TaxID=3363894 RepID=UPI0037983CF7